jgi:cytochrome bd-type quinol oxidase subunit 2
MLDAARKGELESISLTPSTTGTSVETFATVMPPVLMGSVFAAMVLTGDNSGEIRSWTLAIGLLVVHSVISVLFVWWLTGTRGLTLQQRVVWITTATLLGLGTVMAVLAVYPKLVKESCTRCGKERRVDLDDCEHCNRPWDAPPSEGIEILEGELAEGRELAQMA